MRLWNPLLLSGLLPLSPDFLAPLHAYAKPVCQFLQAAGTRLIRFQKLAAQVIGIGLRHPFGAAKIADTTVPRFTSSVYSNYGSALADLARAGHSSTR